MAKDNYDDRLMTLREVAERLGYSPDWVRSQVRSGNIPVIKFNKRAWRFHWKSVLTSLTNKSLN